MTLRFPGFSPAALVFLEDLAANNERTWFQANKARYEALLRQPMADMVQDIANIMSLRELPLTGDPKRSLFRVNRDIRFSHDKRPYKTHIASVFTRSGDKKDPGLLYLHIQPQRLAPSGSFVAAGFWQPEPARLAALRAAIQDEPDRFHAMVAGLAGAGLQLSSEDRLQRLPRGIADPGDPVLHQVLRLKSFIVSQSLPQAALADPRATLERIVAFAEAALPLLRFGWSVYRVA